MRQASIILPHHYAAEVELQKGLLSAFGGFTKSKCSGSWRDDTTGIVHEDQNSRYDVAMEDTAQNLSTLRNLARWAGQGSDQICVYLQTPAGDIEFVETRQSVEGAISQGEDLASAPEGELVGA